MKMERFSSNCWSGRLCIKGIYPCTAHTQVQNGIEVLADWGKCLNIRWRANASTTKDRFLKGLTELPNATEITLNGWFINVFHMKPRQCPTNFEKLRVYLRKNSYMAVLKHGKEVMLMTDSQLMSELFGISGQEETGVLCCILLSKQSKVMSGLSKSAIKREFTSTSDVMSTEFYEVVPESSKLQYADIRLAFQASERDELTTDLTPSKTCIGIPSVQSLHRYSTFIKEKLLEDIDINKQRGNRKNTYSPDGKDNDRKRYGKRLMVITEKLQAEQGESQGSDLLDNHGCFGMKGAKYPKLDSDRQFETQTGKLLKPLSKKSCSSDRSPLQKAKLNIYNEQDKQGEKSSRNDQGFNTVDERPSVTMNKSQKYSESQRSLPKVAAGAKTPSNYSQVLVGSNKKVCSSLSPDNRMMKSPMPLKKKSKEKMKTSDNNAAESEKWDVKNSTDRHTNSRKENSRSSVSCKSSKSRKYSMREKFKTRLEKQKTEAEKVFSSMQIGLSKHEVKQLGRIPKKTKTTEGTTALTSPRNNSVASDYLKPVSTCVGSNSATSAGDIPKNTSVACDYTKPISICVGSNSATPTGDIPKDTSVTCDYTKPLSICVDSNSATPTGDISKNNSVACDYTKPVSTCVGSNSATPTGNIPKVEELVTSTRKSDISIKSHHTNSSGISLENNRVTSPNADRYKLNISPILESLAREVCTPLCIQLERVDTTDESSTKYKQCLDYVEKSPKGRKSMKSVVDNSHVSQSAKPSVCVTEPAKGGTTGLEEIVIHNTNTGLKETVIFYTNTGLDETVIYDTFTCSDETVIYDTTAGSDDTLIYDTTTGSDETVIYDTTTGSDDTLIYDSCTLGRFNCGDDYAGSDYKVGWDDPVLSERGDSGMGLIDRLTGSESAHRMIQSARAEKRKITRRKRHGLSDKSRETSMWLSNVLSKGKGDGIPGLGDLETVRMLDLVSGQEDLCVRTVVNSNKGPRVAISGFEVKGELGKDKMQIEDTVNAALHSSASLHHLVLDDLASLCVVVGFVLHQPMSPNLRRKVSRVETASKICTYMIEISQTVQLTPGTTDSTHSTVGTNNNGNKVTPSLVATASPKIVQRPADDQSMDEPEKVNKTDKTLKNNVDTVNKNEDSVQSKKEKLKLDIVKLNKAVEMLHSSTLKTSTNELHEGVERIGKNSARSPDIKHTVSPSVVENRIAQTVPSDSILESKLDTGKQNTVDSTIAQTVPSESLLESKLETSKQNTVDSSIAQTVPSESILESKLDVYKQNTVDSAIAQTVPSESILESKLDVYNQNAVDSSIAQTVPSESLLESKLDTSKQNTIDSSIAQTVPSDSILESKLDTNKQNTVDSSIAQTVLSDSILESKLDTNEQNTVDSSKAQTVPSESILESKLDSNKQNTVNSSESKSNETLAKHTASSDMKTETDNLQGKDHIVLEKTNSSQVLLSASDSKNINSMDNRITSSHEDSIPNDTASLVSLEDKPPSLKGKTSKPLKEQMDKVSHENNKGSSPVKEKQSQKYEGVKIKHIKIPDNQALKKVSKEPSPTSKTDKQTLRTKDKGISEASTRATPTKDTQDQRDGREKIKFGRTPDSLQPKRVVVSKATSAASKASTRSTPSKDGRSQKDSIEKTEFVSNRDAQKFEKAKSTSASRQTLSPTKDKRHSQSSLGLKGSTETCGHKSGTVEESLQITCTQQPGTDTSKSSGVDTQSVPIKDRLVSLATKSMKSDTKSDTKKTGKRQARQYHPYRKESKPVDKSIPAWSFDIAYRDMNDLLQNMTENQFRNQGLVKADVSLWRSSLGRTDWTSRMGGYGRFRDFRFSRSSVPTTLPTNLSDYENKEESVIMPEEIPNLKERQLQADLVEQMFIGDETENFSIEKPVHCNVMTDDSAGRKILAGPLSMTIPMGIRTTTYSGTLIDEDNEASVELAYSNSSRKIYD